MPKITITSHKILLGFTFVHLALAAVLPLMFFEAHYALYGYYVQLSYVDHPPLMGWLQALVQLGGSSEFALRLMPILITLATQYTLLAIALRLYPHHAKIDVTLAWLLQLLPISHIAFMAAPDLPLALFTCLGFWFLLDILERNSWGAWIGLGLSFGLAGLSKYTAVSLVISLPLALWVSGRGWRWLLSPKVWLAVGIALILISPVILWNLAHDWLSFRFQTSYQAGRGGWSALALLKALGAQAATYSPFFVLLLLGLKQGQAKDNKGLILGLCWALPTLILFLIQAGAGRSSPHWTYASWLALTPALAFGFMQYWPKRKILRQLSYTWSAALALVALIIIALPWLGFADYKHPLKRKIGWELAAAHGLALKQAWIAELQSQGEDAHLPTLMVYNWHYAEPLAWYARPEPVRDIRRKTSQFDNWFGSWAQGDRGILIRPKQSTEPPNTHIENVSCHAIDQISTTIAGNKGQVFHYYRCVWPLQQ